MLAKQGWRLLLDQESFLCKRFKAKYFPWCSFLEASNSPNSSYVWKSLLAAQLILRKGCCWRVGNGTSIWVLSDKWIPCHPTNKILISPNDEEWEWWVSDLIDWTTFQWDKDLICLAFQRFDAEAILRIPLSRRYVPDVLVWMYNKNGIYLVRLGYHTARMLLKEVGCGGESFVLVSSN